MAENISQSPHIEAKEKTVDASLQLAKDFFQTLTPDDKELFELDFESPEVFSALLKELSIEQQQNFQRLL